MTKSSRNQYVVLGGGGAMGRAIARDLYDSSAEARILVADLNLEAVRATARSLGQGADPGGRVEARQVDVRDTAAMAGLLKGRDVVINASNYYWNVQVMRAALEAGTHYLDLGGLFHTTRKQLELDRQGQRDYVCVEQPLQDRCRLTRRPPVCIDPDRRVNEHHGAASRKEDDPP